MSKAPYRRRSREARGRTKARRNFGGLPK
ncbi:hypothetical protein HKBW3S06_01626, partial [Candidatus Hakubella thermalkaliphila]